MSSSGNDPKIKLCLTEEEAQRIRQQLLQNAFTRPVDMVEKDSTQEKTVDELYDRLSNRGYTV